MALNEIFSRFPRIFEKFKNKDSHYKVLDWKYLFYVFLAILFSSIFIPFIEGTEPKIIPQNRKKCRINKESYTSKVINKIKEAIEAK